MTAKTNAQRKAEERQRYTEAGLRRVPDLWALPKHHAKIKAFAAKLNKVRQSPATEETR